MKLFALLLLFISASLSAQIKNAGFEISLDSAANQPKNWSKKLREGYSIELSDNTYYAGNKSLEISTNKPIAENIFQPFSQICEIEINKLQILAITAFIKTENVNDHTGLWCQLWDKDEKTIGFGNLAMQGIKISGNNDWKMYRLNLTAGNDVKKLMLGGYLSGEGKAWFDNFNIELNDVSGSPASAEVKKYIDGFLQIIKSNSLYTDSINWDTLIADCGKLSGGMDSVAQTRTVIDYILGKLRAAGDNHSFFQPKQNAADYSSQNVDGRQPEGYYLADNIGYIKVPGFGSINDTAGLNFAKKIQQLIKTIEQENKIKGWIVDLRENTGGNMYPMIAGLGPLIGNGIAGYFITRKSTNPWTYNKGTAGIYKIKKTYKLKHANPKIAVLIGPQTASSGEMTAISFIGKPNTKLFGLASAGYTTGNAGFPLSDGSYLYLATSYTADRNMKKYIHKIDPDVVVEIKESIDNTIEVAKNWLLKN